MSTILALSNTAPSQHLPQCKNKHRLRLFVGEGNFSYTEALIKKHENRHPSLAASIIATELITKENYESKGKPKLVITAGSFEYLPEGETETLDRIERLKQLGVKVLLGLDCTKLAEDETIKSVAPIPRIHWNLPLNDQSEGDFSLTLRQFFSSSDEIQKVGDRIHITLLQGQNGIKPTQPNFAPEWIFQQGYKAKIVLASTIAGYKLIKKRKFLENGNIRYPGYVTRNSFSGNPLKPSQLTFIRELIFEKQGMMPTLPQKGSKYDDYLRCFQDFVDPSAQKIKVDLWHVKMKEAKVEPVFYYECKTESDSSSYSSSSSVDEVTEGIGTMNL